MSETTGFEAIDPDLLRPGRTYLRRGLFAAYLAGIAGVAVLALCEAWRPEFPYTWNVQDCLQDRELCEGSEVHLSGALVPGSLAESTPPRCFFRMEMQAPGGVPGGKLTVCSDRQSVPSALIPGGCGDKRMDRVLELKDGLLQPA